MIVVSDEIINKKEHLTSDLLDAIYIISQDFF